MSRVTVIGGTGYAGSAVVAEAAARGHRVTALSRSLPQERIPEVTYIQGDATDDATLSQAIRGADVVASAYSARGPLAVSLRDFYRSAARVADAEGVPLYIVGGYSSLRPSPGADRFVTTDLSDIPEELHEEIRDGSQVIIEDLPATPDTLNWIFVSPRAPVRCANAGRAARALSARR